MIAASLLSKTLLKGRHENLSDLAKDCQNLLSQALLITGHTWQNASPSLLEMCWSPSGMPGANGNLICIFPFPLQKCVVFT